MAKKSKDDPAIIDIVVSTNDNDMKRHKGKCPVANSMKFSNPGEIMFPKADRDNWVISWSSRSEDVKYAARMPVNVHNFITKWDGDIIPLDIRMVIRESDIISREPRTFGGTGGRRSAPNGGPKRASTQRSARRTPTKRELAKAMKKAA